jgi:hypothetical protein
MDGMRKKDKRKKIEERRIDFFLLLGSIFFLLSL